MSTEPDTEHAQIVEHFSERISETLIPQPHGGAIRPGQRAGEPGRPNAGRPASITVALLRLLRMRPARLQALVDGGRLRMQDQLALALIQAGIDGNIDAIKLAWDRSPDGPLIAKTISEHIETRKLVISPKPKRQAQLPPAEAQDRVIDIAPSAAPAPVTDSSAPNSLPASEL